MWSKANSTDALTKVGQRLGADLQRVTRANALLGYGVSGISAPGYGNLTQVGIAEHRQLAARLASRVAPLLDNTAAQARTAPRQVVVSTSGVNRAVDSASFFTQSLAATVPGLGPLIVSSAALTAYPAPAPVTQAPGVNRFQLYFHKLTAGTDLPLATDAVAPVYQSSAPTKATWRRTRRCSPRSTASSTARRRKPPPAPRCRRCSATPTSTR